MTAGGNVTLQVGAWVLESEPGSYVALGERLELCRLGSRGSQCWVHPAGPGGEEGGEDLPEAGGWPHRLEQCVHGTCELSEVCG